MNHRRPPPHPYPHPFPPSPLPLQNFPRVSSNTGFSDSADDGDLQWPFGRLDTFDRDELRETAYEIFFTSCRSSPGFASVGPTAGSGGSRNNLACQASDAAPMDSSGRLGAGGANGGGGTGMMAVTSRLKRALGLRTRRSAPMRAMHMGSPLVSPAGAGGGGGAGSTGTGGMGGGGGGGPASMGKGKQRPMTAAEIMRQQMGVTEQSDNRLRKTLTRSLVGQGGKKTESIVPPLELLRHLKPSEFSNAQDYHRWQRRQLKVLEAGLVLYPSVPLDRLNTAGLRFSDIMHASELKPIDTSKNSEAMRTLSTCVTTLAWHNQSGTPVEVCHWADGYPLNIHLYLALLRSIFDLRDETVVLDEVDELLELMKRTWPTLAINRMVHNVCLTWVLFEQYISTGQIEPDLMAATLSMLIEVATDAKKHEREPGYVRVLSATMASMNGWAEKRLLDYFEWFDKGALGMMDHVLCLALSTAKIITEGISNSGRVVMIKENENGDSISSSQDLVEHYIKSSMRRVFTKALENRNGNNESMIVEVDEDPTKTLMHIAKKTEELAFMQKEVYSPTLKRWHPTPTAATVVTLNNCFGTILKQYFSRVKCLTNELVRVLHTARKLEKTLLQMALEDSADSEDGGKGIIKEMITFEVDSIISNIMKSWLSDRLRMARECVDRAKETESWHPKSKTEPYTQSVVDLVKLVKMAVDEISEIQVAGRDEAVADLADGLDSIFQEFISFVASCGSKKSYIPQLPPLTRCNQDSVILALWKKAATPCKAGVSDPSGLCARRSGDGGGGVPGPGDTPHNPRPTTSRGTQRLYIRLNTLQFLLSHLHSTDKSLSFFARNGTSSSPRTPVAAGTPRRRALGNTSFEAARNSIHSAIHHIAEVAAYRLIFHDSSQFFYHALYIGSVAEARIQPTIRLLKQNLTLLLSLVTDRAQPMALREVMKVAFEAYMMVLVAGGTGRAFSRSDHEMVAEDLSLLKRMFCESGEGMVAEEAVERESAAVEGVVTGLMSMQTEKLVQEFSIAACEASGLGRSLERVPMPEPSGRWHRSDPFTMLGVLCHRDDDVASRFLKRTFDLAKRR